MALIGDTPSYMYDEHYSQMREIYPAVLCDNCGKFTGHHFIRHIQLIDKHICNKCCKSLSIKEVNNLVHAYDLTKAQGDELINQLFEQL